MKIELVEKSGYGPNCYLVKYDDWEEIRRWLHQNEIEHWQVSSSYMGIGFQIKDKIDKIEWFNLKWL